MVFIDDREVLTATPRKGKWDTGELSKAACSLVGGNLLVERVVVRRSQGYGHVAFVLESFLIGTRN